ncbi:hypothetical protein TGME49_241890 [Toxoplasma gondii ME49]|uniref:Uncharacterized protein n=11 Tax=Toxoplasma gondii TaxID=5811 RepID=A0A125YMJ1_TOXGV|nr:hypothetical protein TGME49_241890 [Toxoplasma gondii ME49]EPT30627.1 hypothetical protein TGME49_241890 [Toxoplasma gondii ME49]ESS31503.1 hypothetical protein TGVEG_241890 [Toxoplasma gondii VEG]CEL73464.1 TPA: hypothetical protein BN1205_089820 [Toxoplasma gondii VEG]|eukprot:XP_018637588.1 hypothetical protein TGME49_241890 [Toxoplasma gondii ME49]
MPRGTAGAAFSGGPMTESEATAAPGCMRAIQGHWVTVYPVASPNIWEIKSEIEKEVAPCCDYVYDSSLRELHICFQSEALANSAVLLGGGAIAFSPQFSTRFCSNPDILRRRVITDFSDDWPMRWEQRYLLFKVPNLFLELCEGFCDAFCRFLFGARCQRSRRSSRREERGEERK